MPKNLLTLIQGYLHEGYENLAACQKAMQELYPNLLLRWSHIYGNRWAHISGDTTDTVCLNPVRIKISQDYGICIDNVEIVNTSQLEDIVKDLKEGLACETARQ